MKAKKIMIIIFLLTVVPLFGLQATPYPNGQPRVITQDEIDENQYELDITSQGCSKPEDSYLPGAGFLNIKVLGTNRYVWYRDIKVGSGEVVVLNKKVTLRYWDDWDTDFWKGRHPVRPEYKLQFIPGDDAMGKGLETAILGMKVGGRREAFIRLDLASGLTTDQFKGAYIEIEILEVK